MCVLAGASALSLVVAGSSWVGPAIQLVGLVWLIGVGCRLLAALTPVTVLAQVVGVVLTLTAVFTNGGYAGLIPNARAVREADALLTGAWQQILHSSLPAPGTPELGLLIAIAIGLLAIIVHFFVAEVDAPALVALPLLCLYSVPASIAETLLPWWAFALPAACYVTLIAVAGHAGRRMGLRAGVGVLVAAGVVGVVSIAGSIVVADSVSAVGTAGRVQRTNSLSAGADIGLSTFASLHGDLQQGDAREVLRLRGVPGPDYLRTTALENWNATQGFSIGDPADSAQPIASPVNLQPLAVDPAAVPATVDVEVLNFVDRFVPYYQGATQILGLQGDYSYNPTLGSVFRDEASTPANYQMVEQYGQIQPDLLRADRSSASPQLVSTDGMPASAAELARAVTATGETTFDKALLLQKYFTDPANGFVYSLSVPTGNTGNLLTDFLQQKQGYCEQYAAAMAVMLRSLGIPARVAIGFTQGTETAPHEFLITSHDAHAWVEVRFDTYGWVRFDPTPLSSAVGQVQGYQTTPADASAANSSATTASDTVDQGTRRETQARDTVNDFDVVTRNGGTGGAQADSFWKPWYTGTLLALALIALVAALPSWWRRRQARRRLAVARDGGARAPAAAWEEVEALAIDHGFAPKRGASVRRAANQLARDGQLSERGRAGLRRIALGTESAWYSPDGYRGGETDLAEDVQQIAVDFEHTAPRPLTTKVLPRSLIYRD